MKKRLRYAMPRKPLSACKEQDDVQNNAEGGNGIHDDDSIGAGGSNVRVMVRRISQMERKKRRDYEPPRERPLAGDFSSSESDEDDREEAYLINE